MCKKRGQITIFMVIGIIMIITLALFFYARDLVTKAQMTSKVMKITDNRAIYDQLFVYSQSCLYTTGARQLEIMAKKGGYNESSTFTFAGIVGIEGSEKGIAIIYDKTSTPPKKEPGDAKELIDNFEIDFTKSMYQGLYKEKCFAPNTKIVPDVLGVKTQGVCTPGATNCIRLDEVTESGNRTRFADNITIIKMQYPVLFNLSSSNIEISRFSVEVPVELKEMIHLAYNITEYIQSGGVKSQPGTNCWGFKERFQVEYFSRESGGDKYHIFNISERKPKVMIGNITFRFAIKEEISQWNLLECN